MENKVSDYQLIEKYKNYSQIIRFKDTVVPPCHPLSNSIINVMDKVKLVENSADDFIYRFSQEVNQLWKLIISESISCLRYFDSREPFKKNEKKFPIAIGVEELGKYYNKYCDFEPMLYGAEKKYRDHTVHAFRCYILGIDCLLCDDAKLLNRMNIGNVDENGQLCNSYEKLSIWAIISLVHDIGYPLEKTRRIITETKDMMAWFVNNPEVGIDLSFDGVQTTMNDYVVRMISSKMVERPTANGEGKTYVSRIQPKFYYKYLKSLSEFRHGIISSIFTYKMLTFFLESDFSINEDYHFNAEDVRQFSIRREILRAIASHTCDSIYQIDVRNFSLILRIIDEAQEWGRKQFHELVTNQKSTYELRKVSFGTSEKADLLINITIEESYKFSNSEEQNRAKILEKLLYQFSMFSNLFRDGQYSDNRNFGFVRKVGICCGKESMEIELSFPKFEEEKFSIYGFSQKKFRKIWEKHISRETQKNFKIFEDELNMDCVLIGRKSRSL